MSAKGCPPPASAHAHVAEKVKTQCNIEFTYICVHFSPLSVFKSLLKCLPERRHICNSSFGFSPLCLFKCLVKLFAWKDARSHSLQLFGFSPVCLLNVSPIGMTGRMQSHTNSISLIFHIRCGCIFGFSPLCLFKCLVKLFAWKDARSHRLHFLAFLQCVFSNVSSNGMTGRMRSHTSCIALQFSPTQFILHFQRAPQIACYLRRN